MTMEFCITVPCTSSTRTRGFAVLPMAVQSHEYLWFELTESDFRPLLTSMKIAMPRRKCLRLGPPHAGRVKVGHLQTVSQMPDSSMMAMTCLVVPVSSSLLGMSDDRQEQGQPVMKLQ
jgi:hypothetical protein